MRLNIDGTEEFSFSIPMYIYIFEEKDRYKTNVKESRMIKKENPIWYNTRNGNLMENLRKLKVIFNKKTADE